MYRLRIIIIMLLGSMSSIPVFGLYTELKIGKKNMMDTNHTILFSITIVLLSKIARTKNDIGNRHTSKRTRKSIFNLIIKRDKDTIEDSIMTG